MIGYVAKGRYVSGDILTLTLCPLLQVVPQVLTVVGIEKPILKLAFEVAKPTRLKPLEYAWERSDNIVTRYTDRPFGVPHSPVILMQCKTN